MLGVGTVGGRGLVTETPGELLEQKVFCSVIGVLGRAWIGSKQQAAEGGEQVGPDGPQTWFLGPSTPTHQAHTFGARKSEKGSKVLQRRFAPQVIRDGAYARGLQAFLGLRFGRCAPPPYGGGGG